MNIAYSNVYDSGRAIRFVVGDERPNGRRINFINVYGQNCRVITEEECGRPLFPHANGVVEDVLKKIEDDETLNWIPERFWEHTHVWNVPGVLSFRGINVPLRVLRQQVLLGASPYHMPLLTTVSLIYGGIGQALWDYMRVQIWGRERDRKPFEYRELRGANHMGTPKGFKREYGKYGSMPFEDVVGRDFDYLFGTYPEWDMQGVLSPPDENARKFWLDAFGEADDDDGDEGVVPAAESVS